MTTYLLDANVLIALTINEHEYHRRASAWLASVDRFVLCPVVEGALVRFLLRMGESGATARAILDAVHDHPRSSFRADELSYRAVAPDSLQGHRQVTDAYLAALATQYGCLLATFDRGLAARHPVQCRLVP